MGHRDVLVGALSLAAIAGSVWVVGCARPKPVVGVTKPLEERSGVELGRAQLERIDAMGFPGPPPHDPSNKYGDDLASARLGQWLFFDTGLSSTGTFSCATCHQPDKRFTDGLAVAEALARGVRNTPTILDVAHQTWFNWDGRFDSLWSQSHGPLSHPREMGGTFESVVARVMDDPNLRKQYEAIFGQSPTRPLSSQQVEVAIANLGKTIAAYERKLVTGPSTFDRWVITWRDAGMPRQVDLVATTDFSPAAQRGLDLFTSRGLCWKCHEGKLLSDGEFHALGAAPRGDLISDPGRFGAVAPLKASPFRSGGGHADNPHSERAEVVESLIAVEDQWGAFRTPPLRNLSATAPYFHQGQFDTLEDVLHFYSTLEGAVAMDHHRESVLQVRSFTPEEIADIAAFLRSLDGSDPSAEWTRNPWQADPRK